MKSFLFEGPFDYNSDYCEDRQLEQQQHSFEKYLRSKFLIRMFRDIILKQRS